MQTVKSTHEGIPIILSMRAAPSWPNHLSKASPTNAITFGGQDINL